MHEVIADLEAVANGEPPYLARKKYDHKLLESLATGRTLAETPTVIAAAPPTSPKISVQWVLALGVLLAISILCNVLLFALR